jgi:hypothetical protein
MLYTGGITHVTGGEIRQQASWKSDGRDGSCFRNSVYGMAASGDGSNSNYCYSNTGPFGGNTRIDACPFPDVENGFSPDIVLDYSRGDFYWFDLLDFDTHGTYTLSDQITAYNTQDNPSITCTWTHSSTTPYSGDYQLHCTGGAYD